jgi:hypothetical protein
VDHLRTETPLHDPLPLGTGMFTESDWEVARGGRGERRRWHWSSRVELALGTVRGFITDGYRGGSRGVGWAEGAEVSGEDARRRSLVRQHMQSRGKKRGRRPCGSRAIALSRDRPRGRAAHLRNQSNDPTGSNLRSMSHAGIEFEQA